jgi:hypothetical protein
MAASANSCWQKGLVALSAHHPGKINLIYNFAAQQPAMCLIDKEGDAVRWLRLFEQDFRVDKWSLCRG